MDFTSYQPGATTKLNVTSTSAKTSAFGATNQRVTVRLFATVPMCIAIGDDTGGTLAATADDFELADGVPEYIDIVGGQKIAAIRASSALANGYLKITPVTKRS